MYLERGRTSVMEHLLSQCFFRLSQNVILRIINVRSSVGILRNPLLTGIYQVCSQKIEYSKFFLPFFRYDLINFNLAQKLGAFEEELFHLDFKWFYPKKKKIK